MDEDPSARCARFAALDRTAAAASINLDRAQRATAGLVAEHMRVAREFPPDSRQVVEATDASRRAADEGYHFGRLLAAVDRTRNAHARAFQQVDGEVRAGHTVGQRLLDQLARNRNQLLEALANADEALRQARDLPPRNVE